MFPRHTNAFRGGFTFVELIVAVSIVATIAVVGIAYGSGFRANQNNAVRLSDVDTLKIAAESYFQSKGDYPEPTANRIYFDANGAYAHSSTGSYGVSSSVASDTFWSEFLSDVPRDPDTGNAYGYGKRKDGVAAFDVASVDLRSDGYYAYVKGTYDGSSLPSLVREYNWPGFVEDGKNDRLPYNPHDSKITAKIGSYGGAVTVEPTKALTEELSEGDTVKVPAGWYAVLHVSDGTEARIGSAASATELKLENLETKDSRRFLTKIRFALNGGEVWTKAPKLREDRGESSEIEVVSWMAVASVRGTVFWVSDTATWSVVTLAAGKIELETAGGETVEWTWMTGGILSVADTDDYSTPGIDESAPKTVALEEDEEEVSAGTVTTDESARTKLKEWENGAKREAKPKGMKISRDASGALTLSFTNSSLFSTVFAKKAAGESPFSIVGWAGNVKVPLTWLSTSALKGYPNDADTRYRRLTLRFEKSGGGKNTVEWVIPGDANPFEIDESKIPSGLANECPKTSPWFAKLWCQPSSLVAYAPYERAGDLHLYDKWGRKIGTTVSDLIVEADTDGVPYKKSFNHSAVAGIAGGLPIYTQSWRNGIMLDLYQGDDILWYDISPLGIRENDNVRIELDVLWKGLKRRYSEIDVESQPFGVSWTNPWYNSTERRAYLWSFEDGTSLYLVSPLGDNGEWPWTLVVTGPEGVEASRWSFDRPSLVNDAVVTIQVTFSWTIPHSMLFSWTSYTISKISSPNPNAHPSQYRRLWVGSSAPTTEAGGVVRWHSQWGGRTSNLGEIIDSMKIYVIPNLN